MLANLFKKKNKAIIGVDISSTSVKLIELSEANGRMQVEAYASEALPENAVVEQSITDEEAVGNAIKKAVTRSRSSVKKAGVAVAGSAVITKVIQMGSDLSEDEMENQITVEADKRAEQCSKRLAAALSGREEMDGHSDTPLRDRKRKRCYLRQDAQGGEPLGRRRL